MMALNRHRLRYLASRNAFGARRTQQLLGRPDRLLSLLLIGNNLINTVIPVMTTSIALSTFGHDNSMALSIATAIVALLIIVFAEVAPKIVGATYPERVALPASVALHPLMLVARPLVWLVNAIPSVLFKLLRIDMRSHERRLSPDEMRALVLETNTQIPLQSKAILLNLFDLETIAVEDVMVPRPRVEALDLTRPLDQLIREIETCYHNKLIAYDGDINRVAGVLHVRKTLSALHHDSLTIDSLRAMLATPYFVPMDTPVFRQLRFFQENRQRLGIVVDEYGDVQGIVTPEDIVEEMIGEFTTSMATGAGRSLRWDASGSCTVSGGVPLRELNRALGLKLPLDGPKTLNGLILEHLTEFPDGDVCLTIADCRIEVLQIDHQTIKTARLRMAQGRH
ncbi:Mg2+ and Co2+ transporter CorB, contains DUF21, CBS pair, and CorC-HlyC domains [Chitinasiproducens palmae]|uniref:Mg2+ and Co2+ transporter CorB, contains DUF21, CBS pair, and CorC-HlyC domains n=2 Tax=Chitinasiproducens palmae TaxID=1770053 RepID=A0A1H2PTJ2_9BURK|nr:Mg2+ and Co2+ transporter CorB, contains DUF21, CBS pair, and CorC-HlyC domains [Chitinasiproducens palmae]